MPFVQLTDITQKEVMDGFRARFIHTENITVAYWEIQAGAEIPMHTHVHEMMVNVLEGQLELTLDNEVKILEYGTIAVIPSYVPHKAKGITNCRVLDIFYPVREDYK